MTSSHQATQAAKFFRRKLEMLAQLADLRQ